MGLIEGLFGAGSNLLGIGLQNKWNRKNYELQKDNLQYQKNLQQQVFLREDNAVQRRARDMEAAGLSKTLAAGSAAKAGQTIQTNAPQRSTDGIEKIANTMPIILSMMQQKADISKTEAQTKLVQAQTGEQKVITEIAEAQKITRMLSEDEAVAKLRAERYRAETLVNTEAYRESIAYWESRASELKLSKAKQELLALETANAMKKHNLSIHQATGTASTNQGGQMGYLLEMLTSALESANVNVYENINKATNQFTR